MKTNKITNILLMFGLVCLLISSTTNAQTIPTNGLLAYYPFNGNAKDESGNGKHGHVFNGVYSVDRFGNSSSAVSFSDNTNYGYFSPYSNLLDGNYYRFSLSFWFKPLDNNNIPSSQTPDERIVVNYFQGCQFSVNWRDINDYNYQCALEVKIDGTGPGYIHYTADYSVNLNEWNSIVITKGFNTVNVFVNGTLYNTFTVPNLSNQYGANMFGTTQVSKLFFELDDIRVYNRSLTPQEVFSIFHENEYSPGGGTASVWEKDVNNNISYTYGNVGIGTTTPTERLEVNGNIKLGNKGSFNNGYYIIMGIILKTEQIVLQ